MTIQYTFRIIEVLGAEQPIDGVVGKVQWECDLQEDGASILAAGITFLREDKAPEGVTLQSATTAQIEAWLIASEGGQAFLDRFLAGHTPFVQLRKIDAAMTVPVVRPSPKVTPVVSRFQALAALSQAGYLDDVEAYMADPTTDRFEVLAYENAQEFRRNSPTVTKLQGLLGLTDAQLDDLFTFAATIYA